MKNWTEFADACPTLSRNKKKWCRNLNKGQWEEDWKKCYMKCGIWNQMKIWSSHLLDNLSHCLMNLKNSGDSTGFEPMTSTMPVQCSNQLSYEVTQLRAGQFVGLMFSRERNGVWKKCYMKCGIRNQMKIWSSHLLDNLSNCLMNLKNSGDSTGDICLNCPASARIISSFDFKYRTSYNISFIRHSFHGKTWAQQIDLISTVWLRSSVG